MSVGAGVLERLAHAVVGSRGVRPHDVDIVRADERLGHASALGCLGEARAEVGVTLDLGIDLLRRGDVGLVLGLRRAQAVAADEADAVRLRHEAGDHAGKRADLVVVDLDDLDVVERGVPRKVALRVGVGKEELAVGALLGDLRDDVAPRGGELGAGGDDEVNALVGVGLGKVGRRRCGGVLLRLEELPAAELVAGGLNRVVVRLGPAAVLGGAADHERDPAGALVLRVVGAGRVACGGAPGQARRDGSGSAQLHGLPPRESCVHPHYVPLPGFTFFCKKGGTQLASRPHVELSLPPIAREPNNKFGELP